MSPVSATDLSLEFRAIIEPDPGPQLRDLFNAHWPSYQRWLAKRVEHGPTAAECTAQLRQHMPELAPIFDDLLELVGSDEQRARFLSLYAPTPIIRGCSQAICTNHGGAILVRNYDHAPHLCDGIVLATKWAGVGVNAVTDCLWGALDGVNDAGLIVALAFGGRKVVGLGFSSSLIVRYLLQTCATVKEARAALARLPIYMSYNFTLLDRTGEYITALTSPDRPAAFVMANVSTNHQQRVEWPEYAHFTQSVQRAEHLAKVVARKSDVATVIDTFLKPPLFRSEYRKGSGTLYTVAYDPRSMDISLFWHGVSAVMSPRDNTPARVHINYNSI